MAISSSCTERCRFGARGANDLVLVAWLGVRANVFDPGRRGLPARWRAPPVSGLSLLGEEHVGVGAPVRVQEIGHSATVVTPGEVLV
jgi:hypothetical protein